MLLLLFRGHGAASANLVIDNRDNTGNPSKNVAKTGNPSKNVTKTGNVSGVAKTGRPPD